MRPRLATIIHTLSTILIFPLVCLAQEKLPYRAEELLSRQVRDTYEGDNLNLIAFPLGGIGAGCISLSGAGKLVDWEIFNQPNVGYQPRFSFLSVRAKAEGGVPV